MKVREEEFINYAKRQPDLLQALDGPSTAIEHEVLARCLHQCAWAEPTQQRNRRSGSKKGCFDWAVGHVDVPLKAGVRVSALITLFGDESSSAHGVDVGLAQDELAVGLVG